MFSMTISWTNSSLSILGPRSRSQWIFLEKHCCRSSAFIYGPRLSVLGPRSRSQWLFLEKDCHRSSAIICGPIWLLLHTSVKHDNTLDMVEFECSRAKVKVTVAIFRKTLS